MVRKTKNIKKTLIVAAVKIKFKVSNKRQHNFLLVRIFEVLYQSDASLMMLISSKERSIIRAELLALYEADADV